MNKNKFGAIVPKKITKSLKNFGVEIEHSELLLLMLEIGGEYIIKNKEEVRQSLITIYEDPNNEASNQLVENLKSAKSEHIFDILFYEQYYANMCYARTVDNVITYFKEILSEVILKTPQILKSKESESLEFILNFESIEDLRIAISEKKIEALFYAGIDKIESFFKDRIGIVLFKNEVDKQEFNRIVKNRNIIVHNRSQINKTYAHEFPDSEIKIGEYIKFTYEGISKINLVLSNFVSTLDAEISEKFNLELLDNI